MQYHGIPYNTMQYHAIPCNTIRCNAIPWNTIRYNAMTCNTMQYHKIKCNSIQYHTMPCQKGNFGQSGHKTARRAGEWAPTGKPKVSKVASGYGEVMIPLSLVCLSPTKGGYMGVAWKNLIFGPILGQKWTLPPPHEPAPQRGKHKNVVFLVSRHDGNNFFWWCLQKMSSRPKNCIFDPKKGHFGQSGPENGLPSSGMGTYRKTKCIQSYLRIWGRYDPIESGPSEPKKGGLYGCSVKKSRFLGQKCSFLAGNQFFWDIIQIVCYHHGGTPTRQHFCVDCVARRALGRPPGPIFGHFRPENLHFFTLHPYNPHFFGSDGPDSIG